MGWMVAWLVIAGCDDGTCGELASAARVGDVAAIDAVLDRGAGLECRHGSEWTALHVAASHGRGLAVAALLDRGADLEARGEHRRTALYQAAKYGHLDVVTLLLDRGADLETMGELDVTPLAIAAERQHAAVVDLLLSRGADVHHATSLGESVLHRAVKFATADDPTVVARLIAAGAWVDTHDVDGWTPLHSAAADGHTRIATTLIEAGANPGAVTNRQHTPAELARRDEHADLAAAIEARGGWSHDETAPLEPVPAAIHRTARVVSRSGPRGPALGDRCEVSLLPVEGSRFNCQLEVRCGGTQYYGGSDLGFLQCQRWQGAHRAYDDLPNARDTDPAAGIDLVTRRVFVDSGTPAPSGSTFQLLLDEDAPTDVVAPDAPAVTPAAVSP
jgi:ankyrin repeat protein